MKTVLKDDDCVRNLRLESGRKICASIIRTLIFIGLPICIGFSVFVYYIDPVYQFQYLAPISIIPVFTLFFALLPWTHSRFHNCWIIDEGVIKVRGHTYGSMRIDKMGEWFIESCNDFPEYYHLTVCRRHRMSSAEELTRFLPKNKQTKEVIIHQSITLPSSQSWLEIRKCQYGIAARCQGSLTFGEKLAYKINSRNKSFHIYPIRKQIILNENTTCIRFWRSRTHLHLPCPRNHRALVMVTNPLHTKPKTITR